MEEKKFINKKDVIVNTYSTTHNGEPYAGKFYFNDTSCDCATEKEAIALWAEARLSIIRKYDENRYGRLLTDEELNDPYVIKYKIYREAKYLYVGSFHLEYGRFSFTTAEFARNFLKDNRGLLKKYFML